MNYTCALYAYLAPVRAEVLYVGMCYGTSVRQRWRYSSKKSLWDFLNENRSKNHRLIVGAQESESKITRQVVQDVESLLIYELMPIGNIQSKSSRIPRPGMVVRCKGAAWPLTRRTFRDE